MLYVKGGYQNMVASFAFAAVQINLFTIFEKTKYEILAYIINIASDNRLQFKQRENGKDNIFAS